MEYKAIGWVHPAQGDDLEFYIVIKASGPLRKTTVENEIQKALKKMGSQICTDFQIVGNPKFFIGESND